MLKKLLKYEFKATARTYGGMYLALLAASVLFGGSVWRWNGTNSDAYSTLVGLLSLVYTAVIIGTVVVTIMTIVQRFYRNLLGREGMAHFYAAYNIYSLLLVLSTAGLPVALSRMVSRAAAQRRYGAERRCLHLGLALLAALGRACSAVMCLLPEALAAALHDPDAAPALRTLGPAVLLVCLSAALRGYSQGLGDMVPPAAGQVAESAGELLIGLGLCKYLLRHGAGTDL